MGLRCLSVALSVLLVAGTMGLAGQADDKEKAVPVYPTGMAVPTDPELKNLTWNRYATKNFSVLSTDDGQGQYLANNIEKIKTWTYTRWGLPDQDFNKECRVLCVPDRKIYKKLFGVDDSKVEFRDNLTVMWLVLDDKPSRTVPNGMTEVCLTEYEKKTGTRLGWWAHRGMARLNGHLGDIRADMGYLAGTLKADQPMFWSKSLFGMTATEYGKLKADQQLLYDRQAEAMCLLVRKEYGQVKFHAFVPEVPNYELSVQKVLGFRDYAHFDTTFKRYMGDLSADVLRSRTPDTYLDIRPAIPKK